MPRTWSDYELDDGDFGGKAVALAETEGHFLYSAPTAENIAKALKKRKETPRSNAGKVFST